MHRSAQVQYWIHVQEGTRLRSASQGCLAFEETTCAIPKNEVPLARGQAIDEHKKEPK